MPTFRKLSADEVARIERRGKSQRRLVEEQYDSYLGGFEVGEYGDVEIESSEKRLTVRNRLRAAARRRGVAISFLRVRGQMLRFFVAAPAEDKAAPARRGRGRSKRSA
ncbi:MAG: hypothetical protein KGS47_13610 [Chloroflexi bacterium]|nr:hypothetical protein [Chloroflexota bacterium]